MPWGPHAKRGAIALTFDNFGEAFDVQQGKWPVDKPLGQHYTAVEVLPRLLEVLSANSVSATFFVEAWNAEANPASLRTMVEAGHEVALHGWQHEFWFAQTDQERDNILEKCLAATSKIDITPAGFRPPGGLSTDDSTRLLGAAGLTYHSPAGDEVLVADGMTSLPFRWTDVDALYLEPQLGIVRKELYGAEDLKTLTDWQAVLDCVIEDARDQNQCRVLIFHPYLMGQSKDQFDVFQNFLQRLGTASDIWVATCREISNWAQQNADALQLQERSGNA